jgi:hypothetical protein
MSNTLTTALRPLPLALAFAAHLRAAMTPEDFATIVARNATPEYSKACASHDFCDANMLMAAAFAETFGREPFTTIDVEEGGTTEESLAAETLIWNQAWDWAKAGKFADDAIERVADEQILQEATHAALDEACKKIQDHLGVTTGDFAGIYFSGPNFDEVKSSLQLYLEAQRLDEQDT